MKTELFTQCINIAVDEIFVYCVSQKRTEKEIRKMSISVRLFMMQTTSKANDKQYDITSISSSTTDITRDHLP